MAETQFLFEGMADPKRGRSKATPKPKAVDVATAHRDQALEQSRPNHSGHTAAILAELRRRGPMGATRHELAAALEIRLSTICGRVNALKKAELITEGERRTAAGGRGVVVRVKL